MKRYLTTLEESWPTLLVRAGVAEPLLSVSHTPESQLWAAWALANLTTVNLEEYCEMLEGEGGLTVAQEDRYDQKVKSSRVITLLLKAVMESNINGKRG